MGAASGMEASQITFDIEEERGEWASEKAHSVYNSNLFSPSSPSSLPPSSLPRSLTKLFVDNARRCIRASRGGSDAGGGYLTPLENAKKHKSGKQTAPFAYH